ncbi:MAG: hypothetical protein JWO09_782 [Bacteroidetes bacterium]|nr:hypothetical protein [Bacteroidota bacterium]
MKKFKIPYRLLLSVAAGIAIAAVLSVLAHLLLYAFGIFPAPLKPMFDKRELIISLIYHSVFAMAGAFVTAMLAKEQARKAVFILGSKEAIMWLVGMVVLWDHSPPWFNITKAILGPPLAWFGGKLYQFYKKKHDPANAPVV